MRIVECEQGSSEWLELRRGVITGTRIEQAFKNSDALRNKLIAEKMATFLEPQGSSKDIDRGHALEPMAKKEYEKQTGRVVEEVGFILHPDRDDVGLSPDGIINNGAMAIEVKSPNSQTHVEYMRSKTVPKKYLFQHFGYFLNIPELESIDFVSYDEMNEVKPLHILTLTLDDLLNTEYLKGKKVESMSKLQDKVFAFADSVETEYQNLIF